MVQQLMNRPAYPSDLSDDEWELLKPLIPIHQGVGHPHSPKNYRFRASGGFKQRKMKNTTDNLRIKAPRGALTVGKPVQRASRFSLGVVYIAMIRLMLRRLTDNRRSTKISCFINRAQHLATANPCSCEEVEFFGSFWV